ncbi:MAG: hypothetical protein ABI355_03645 [Solirubrobacteraceae bacterium]
MAVTAAAGAGYAMAASPGSSGAAAAPPGAAAAAPQVFETIDSSFPTLPAGSPYVAKLALPAGTYGVYASGTFGGWDLKSYQGRVLFLSQSDLCSLSSPGRQSLSAGSGPIKQGVFSVNDQATIALTTGATLTFSCRAQDGPDRPGDLVNSSPAQLRISATKISDAATTATIGTTPVRALQIPTSAIEKLTRSGIAADTSDAKKISTILSQVKKLTRGK